MKDKKKDWVIGGFTDCDNVVFASAKAFRPLVSLTPPLEQGIHLSLDDNWQDGIWTRGITRAKKMSAAEAKAVARELKQGYDRVRPGRTKVRAMTLDQGRAFLVGEAIQDEPEDTFEGATMSAAPMARTRRLVVKSLATAGQKKKRKP